MRSAFVLCSVVALALLGFGQQAVAVGVGIGFALYALNVFLLYETGRALLTGGPVRRGGAVAGLSSAGRLLLLAVLLSSVALSLGRASLIGACGGLLISQLNLHFQIRWSVEAG